MTLSSPPQLGKWAALCLATLAGPSAVLAQPSSRTGRVVSVRDGRIQVDVGSRHGVRVGDRGDIVRSGDSTPRSDANEVAQRLQIARVSVVELAERSAIVTVVSGGPASAVRPGDWVILASRTGEGERKAGESTLKREGEEDEFIPLLVPRVRSAPSITSASDVTHGRAWLREDAQLDSKTDLDYSVTRLGSSGTLDRMAGTPWSLEWWGDLSYRDGEGLRSHPDYRDFRVDFRRLSLSRRFEDGESVRAGRFLPFQLPAVGYMDGLQGEVPLESFLRAGAILGFKPGRRDLDFSVKEPGAVAYTTLELGEPAGLYYSGTLGALGALYKGKADRLALLLDQRADLGRDLSLYSTSEIDFDVGGAETRSGPRLSRLDLYARYRVTRLLGLRAGVDHFERPDTRAEREVVRIDPVDLDKVFTSGTWRYWFGSDQTLPWKLRLDEELTIVDAPEQGSTLRWRVSLSRFGLPLMPAGQLTATVYNLEGTQFDGHGGILTAWLPVGEDLYVYPSFGFRFFDGVRDFEATDLSLDADWHVTDAICLSAGGTFTFGDALNRTLLHAGVEYSW